MCGRKIALFALLVPLLFIYSCFNSYQRYPSEWEPVQTSTADCTDISGVYNNIGEPADIKLAYFLLTRYRPFNLKDALIAEREGITRVEITLISDNELKIIGWEGDKLIDERVIRKGPGLFGITNFKCKQGAIKIFGSGTGEAGGGGFLVSRKSYYLSKNTAGNLILKYVDFSFGCCLFLPFAGSSSAWYRYEPVVKEKSEDYTYQAF